MAEKDNVRVVEECLRAMNAHDFVRARSYLDDGFQFQGPASPDPLGVPAYGVHMQELWTAFPDLNFDPTHIIAQGDHMVVNYLGTGTHNGPMTTPNGDTVPATGRRLALPASSTFELKDGRMVRERAYLDLLTLLAQLGLVPGA